MLHLRSKSILATAVWMGVWLGAVCASAIEWKGRIIIRDGVRYVINPSVGFEPTIVLKTQEIWRRGGDDEEVLFGRITELTRARSGNSYLLDPQLNQVHVIGTNGRYVRAIGRSGEGPGDFRMPGDVVLLSENIVCVTQVFPGRLVLLTVDGLAMSDHPLPRDPELGSAYINGCAAVNGQLVLSLARMVHQETSLGLRTSFVRINAEGRIITTYWELLQEMDFANMAFDEKTDAGPVWSVGTDGSFYINEDWDSYSIRVIGQDGMLEHVIEREYEHRKRSHREIERVEERKRSGEISPETKVSETSRDVVRILPRNDGSLWVLSSSGEKDVPEGTVGKFDVFDESGRFVRQISVQGPYCSERDEFHLVDDYIFVVTNVGELGCGDEMKSSEANKGAVKPMEVICLKLANGQ